VIPILRRRKLASTSAGLLPNGRTIPIPGITTRALHGRCFLDMSARGRLSFAQRDLHIFDHIDHLRTIRLGRSHTATPIVQAFPPSDGFLLVKNQPFIASSISIQAQTTITGQLHFANPGAVSPRPTNRASQGCPIRSAAIGHRGPRSAGMIGLPGKWQSKKPQVRCASVDIQTRRGYGLAIWQKPPFGRDTSVFRSIMEHPVLGQAILRVSWAKMSPRRIASSPSLSNDVGYSDMRGRSPTGPHLWSCLVYHRSLSVTRGSQSVLAPRALRRIAMKIEG